MKVINSKIAAIGLAAFVFASCKQLMPESSSSQEQLRQEHLLLPTKFISLLLFPRMQESRPLQKT